jgi:hypothetical protein
MLPPPHKLHGRHVSITEGRQLKVQRWGGLYWHNVRTRLYENPITVPTVIRMWPIRLRALCYPVKLTFWRRTGKLRHASIISDESEKVSFLRKHCVVKCKSTPCTNSGLRIVNTLKQFSLRKERQNSVHKG